MVKKGSRLIFLLHNKTLLKALFYHFKKRLPPITEDNINKNSKAIFNYKYNCKNPKTFNEHLGWMKINYKNNLWKMCADKLGSKDFLHKNGFDKYIVKTLKTYSSSKEIDLAELPDCFVLKTNHDCGTVFICDKKKTNFEYVFKKLDESIEKKYSNLNNEWVYEDIKPCIFAEELLYPRKGKVLIDYKLFAFNGFFGWGFTGQNRNVDTRFTVFERDFLIQNVEYIYLKPNRLDLPPKPEKFDEMVRVSEELSKLLDFVRVDFYDSSEGLKIGELTFFSQSGAGPFTKKEFDYKYGKFFDKTKIFKK